MIAISAPLTAVILIPHFISFFTSCYIRSIRISHNFAISDPLNRELTEKLSGIRVCRPESMGEILRPILSNRVIFGTDLYEAGIGDKVSEIFTELAAGPGAVRATIRRILG